MRSIWTDLLSLHGYLIRRDDLAWRDDGTVRRAPRETDPGEPASPPAAVAPKRRGLRWPRLSAPH